MTDFLLQSNFNTRHLSAISTVPSCCFGPSWKYFTPTHDLWRLHSSLLSRQVHFINWLNVIALAISWHPLPFSKWTLHPWYTSLLPINTWFRAEGHFFHLTFPYFCTYFFHAACVTHVIFDLATKHVARFILELCPMPLSGMSLKLFVTVSLALL